MSLQDIVNVQISRETAAVSQEGFGTAMILSHNTDWSGTSSPNDIVRSYGNIGGLAADGFSTSGPTYTAASAYFAQNPTPSRVYVGRRRDAYNVTVEATPNSGSTYGLTINSHTITYVAGSESADSVRDQLVAKLKNDANIKLLVDAQALAGSGELQVIILANAGSITIADASTSGHVNTISSKIIADAGADLAAIALVNSDWYGLVLAERDNASVESCALWCEAAKKFFAAASNDSQIISLPPTSDTGTSIAAILKAANYTHTVAMYHANADTIYPDAALLGLILPLNPGSYTAKFKTLSAIPVSNLTDTQAGNATGKNCMVFVPVGGVSMTEEGQTASGEYIDVIIGIDWLQARMTERIFGRLVNLPKIPFTDPGIAVIEAEIKAQLKDAVSAGLLAATPAPTVTVPLAKDISSIDKAARQLNGITFLGYLAGAIHSTTIQGVVTL